MTGESFGERLRRLRQERHIGQRALATAVGKSKTWLVHLETGQRWQGKLPPLDDLQRLAEELNMTVSELVGFSTDNERPSKPALALVPKRQLTDDELFDKIGAGYVEDIPYIEDVTASAGPGSSIPQDIDDTLPKRSRRRYFKHLRSLIVSGRCLEPDLCPGDLIHIDRDREPIVGKVVVAVRDEEEALIKRLVRRGGEQYLTANDGRPDILVDEHIRILGLVVAYQRHLL